MLFSYVFSFKIIYLAFCLFSLYHELKTMSSTSDLKNQNRRQYTSCLFRSDFKLTVPKLGIKSAFFQKRGVISLFNNLTIIHNKNNVSLLDG